MRKTISTTEARNQLGRMLDDVEGRGAHYIITRGGKVMAAVVPVELSERWHRSREALFALIDEIHARNADADPDELERDIAEAVREAREELRGKPQ